MGPIAAYLTRGSDEPQNVRDSKRPNPVAALKACVSRLRARLPSSWAAPMSSHAPMSYWRYVSRKHVGVRPDVGVQHPHVTISFSQVLGRATAPWRPSRPTSPRSSLARTPGA